MELSIMPECYADTMLIEALVPPKNKYNHKASCSKVIGEMKYGRLAERFAVGIIDNDKNQVPFLEEFDLIDEVGGRLELLKRKQKCQFVIRVCPALERWILDVCQEAKIDHDYGSLDELKAVTKKQTSSSNEELRKLLKQLSKRTDIEVVRKMKGWLKMLIEKNYQVDINELKNV